MQTTRIAEPIRAKYLPAGIKLLIAWWVLAIVIALVFLFRYEFTSATMNEKRDDWPSSCPFNYSTERPNLLVFVHPRCPCSFATADELQRIVANNTGDDINVTVVAYTPSDAPPLWRSTPLVQQIKNLPQVQIVFDEDGELAKVFGALTSGETYLFDCKGKCLFHGGITPSRGHKGQSASADSLCDYLKNPSFTPVKTSPVYGCPLFASNNR